jgi:hypothetical protein
LKGVVVMVAAPGFDRWSTPDLRWFALQGEDDYSPLRPPMVDTGEDLAGLAEAVDVEVQS